MTLWSGILYNYVYFCNHICFQLFIFTQVMELLVHLNKRIKSRPKIQLPVETLLVQYQDPAAASFVTNFTIIYIKMGYPRLETSKQCELAPTLLTAMEGKPQPQQDR